MPLIIIAISTVEWVLYALYYGESDVKMNEQFLYAEIAGT